MITVNIPHRDAVAQFPDNTPKETIERALREQFPRNGEDVANDLQDRTFKPTESDFKLYEDYLKSSDDDTSWMQLLIDGGGAIMETVGRAAAGVVTNPTKAPASVVEGAAQGTKSLYQLLAQSENPESVSFRIKDALFNDGSLQDRYNQFLKAREFGNSMERNASGEETIFLPKEAVDNRIVQGAALGLDISSLIPIGGQLIGAGKLASKITAKGMTAAGKAARVAAAPVNRSLDAAAAGVRNVTGLSAHELQIAAGAAGVGALANPVGQTVAGVVAGARGVDIVGEALQRVGTQMAKEPSRLAPFHHIALDESARKGVQRFANVAHRMGGDFALDLAPRVAQGGIEGALVGGTLGFYSNGEEGALSGIGGGLVLGGIGAGAVRSIQHANGTVGVERGIAGLRELTDRLPESEIIGSEMTPYESSRVDALRKKIEGAKARPSSKTDALVSSWQSEIDLIGNRVERRNTVSTKSLAQRLGAIIGAEVRGGEGLIADYFTHNTRRGKRVILIDDSTRVPDRFKAGGTKFRGAYIDQHGTTLLNVDAIQRAFGGKSGSHTTLPHELIHSIFGDIVTGEMVNIGRSKLFGVRGPDGSIVTAPLRPEAEVRKFAEDYASKLGTEAREAWNKVIDAAFSTTAKESDRIVAQNQITDEFIASYGGETLLGKTLFRKKTKYSGELRGDRIDTVGQSIAALIRDTWMRVAESRQNRDTYLGDGEFAKNRQLDKFVRELIDRKSLSEDDQAVRSRVQFKDAKDLQTVADTYGAHDLFGRDSSGKIVRAITPDEDAARSRQRAESIKAKLDTIVESERGVRRATDEDGNEVLDLSRATEAERKLIEEAYNPEQRQTLRRVFDSIDGAVQRVYELINFTAVRKGRNGRNQYVAVAPSTREVIPYKMELLSADGNLYFRAVDMDQVYRNFAQAMKVADYKNLYKNSKDFADDLKLYLEHLTKSDKPDSTALFGNDLKRQFFYEVMGTRLSKNPALLPKRQYRAGYIHKEKNNPFKSFRIDRVSRMTDTGDRLHFNEQATYRNTQAAFQPEVGAALDSRGSDGQLMSIEPTNPQRVSSGFAAGEDPFGSGSLRSESVGESTVFDHGMGYRAIGGGAGKLRVYGPDKKLIGVTKDKQGALDVMRKDHAKATKINKRKAIDPIQIAVAPLRIQRIKDITSETHFQKIKFRQLTDLTHALAEELGIGFKSEEDTFGVFQEDASKPTSVETSRLMTLNPDVTIETARTFAAMLGVLSPEMQASVMIFGPSSGTPNGHKISFSARTKAAVGRIQDALAREGVVGYSFNHKKNEFTIAYNDENAFTKVKSVLGKNGKDVAAEGATLASGNLEFLASESYRGIIETWIHRGQGRGDNTSLAHKAIERLDAHDALAPVRERARQVLESLPENARSAVNLLRNGVPHLVGSGKNGTMTVKDVARYFDSISKELGQLKDMSPENAEIIADALFREVVYQLMHDSNAVGWYDDRVTKAMNIITKLHPELERDTGAAFVFKAILAITSQGNDVVTNFKGAELVYSDYKRTGEIRSDYDSFSESAQINGNLRKIREMINERGIDATMKFMGESYTVKQLKSMGFKVGGELAATTTNGAVILGSKIGAFLSNMSGDFTALTMDMWFTRTIRRIAGGMRKDIASPLVQGQIERVRRDVASRHQDELRGYDKAVLMSDDNVLVQYASEIQKDFQKGGFKDKTERNKSANRLISYLNTLNEAPVSGRERKFFRSVVDIISRKLAENGLPQMTRADIQALLWYSEKDLFRLFGEKVVPERAEKLDYVDAAKELARGKLPAGELARFQSEADAGPNFDGYVRPGDEYLRSRPGSMALTHRVTGRTISPEVRELTWNAVRDGRELTQEERSAVDAAVNRDIPIVPATVPKSANDLPSKQKIQEVKAAQADSVVSASEILSRIDAGTTVEVRQDVPSWNNAKIGVVTIHAGGGTLYAPMVRLKNLKLVPTATNEKTSMRIASGDISKVSTIRATGELSRSQSLPRDLESWDQVGFNPDRHSYYYLRSGENAGRPVTSAEEAVQVGNTIFVKNPQLADASNFRFQPEVDDRAYLDAVNRGDMETAQRMVDDAAKGVSNDLGNELTHPNGMPILLQHATPSDWNVFKIPSARSIGWSGNSGQAIWLAPFGSEVRSSKVGDLKLKKLYAFADKVLSVNTPDDAANVRRVYGESLPFFIDSKGLAKLQRDGWNAITWAASKTEPVEVIVFKPSQIKSAEPMVRDDAGNIIPLSKRFDASSPDIRFQPETFGSPEVVGNTSIYTSQSGMRIVATQSGNSRLYDAQGKLAGVYTSVEAAIRKAQKVAAARASLVAQ